MAFLDKAGLEHTLNKVLSRVAQSDWDVNDLEDPAYVKNRPFYRTPITTVEVCPPQTFTIPDINTQPSSVVGAENIVPDETYIVTWNGVEYESMAVSYTSIIVLGNQEAMGGVDTGEPFAIIYAPSMGLNYAIPKELMNDTPPEFPFTYSLSVSLVNYEYVKIDKKYISDDIALKSDIVGEHGEGFRSVVLVPGSGSAPGDFSVLAGNGGYASGESSFVAGFGSRATKKFSTAMGNNSFALSESQTVIGRFNAEDPNDVYSFIVGNGLGDKAIYINDIRRNAHTLDWNGNAWYAGTVKVGGTSYADASEVALKSDIIPVTNGGTGATAAGTTLLSNIGITSGTADAPATGTPGTIYIQYI